MNILVHVLMKINPHICWIYPGAELQGHESTHKRCYQKFFKVIVPSTEPQAKGVPGAPHPHQYLALLAKIPFQGITGKQGA